jgi:hypothetical protein
MPRTLPVVLAPALLAAILLACASERRADAVAGPDEGPAAAAPAGAPAAPAAVAADTARFPDPETEAAFRRIMRFARDSALHTRPYGEIIQAVGRQLLGAPYVAGLLDMSADERLVINLAAFDCVLYVENVLALAHGIALEDYSYDSYVRYVERLRYRGGEREGYCSRLHYFTDWIRDNQRRGNVVDVSEDVGGEPYRKTIDFMSTHRGSYARMADDATFRCIEGVEDDLRDLALYYVPEDRIAEVYPNLQPGDVIATATNIGGLDVTHTGFVYRTAPGQTAFLNASLSGEVKIVEDLATYVQGVRAQTGIIVARPVDPRG